MFKRSPVSWWRWLSEHNDAFYRRLRLMGYIAGVGLCYLIPDEWFQAAGLWLRVAVTVTMNRLGLR